MGSRSRQHTDLERSMWREKSRQESTEKKRLHRIAERQAPEIAISPAGASGSLLIFERPKRFSYMFWRWSRIFCLLLLLWLLTPLLFILNRLACSAFQAVFQRRQTRFAGLLAWLAEQKRAPALRAQAASLGGVVQRFSELI